VIASGDATRYQETSEPAAGDHDVGRKIAKRLQVAQQSFVYEMTLLHAVGLGVALDLILGRFGEAER
jgi:hypothetical protein